MDLKHKKSSFRTTLKYFIYKEIIEITGNAIGTEMYKVVDERLKINWIGKI